MRPEVEAYMLKYRKLGEKERELKSIMVELWRNWRDLREEDKPGLSAPPERFWVMLSEHP